MTLDALLRELVRSEVRAALAEMPERASGLAPIKSRPLGVGYRAILDAERAGQLRVYRRGHVSCVDLAELEQWIRRAPAAQAEPEPVDEIGELIEMQQRRRRRHG